MEIALNAGNAQPKNLQYSSDYGFFEIVRQTKCYYFLKSYKKTIEEYTNYIIFRQIPSKTEFYTHIDELEDKEIKVSIKEYNNNIRRVKNVLIAEGDKYKRGEKIDISDKFYFILFIRQLCCYSKTYIYHLSDLEDYTRDYEINILIKHNENLLNEIYTRYKKLNEEQKKYFDKWLKDNTFRNPEENNHIYEKLYSDIESKEDTVSNKEKEINELIEKQKKEIEELLEKHKNEMDDLLKKQNN